MTVKPIKIRIKKIPKQITVINLMQFKKRRESSEAI